MFQKEPQNKIIYIMLLSFVLVVVLILFAYSFILYNLFLQSSKQTLLLEKLTKVLEKHTNTLEDLNNRFILLEKQFSNVPGTIPCAETLDPSFFSSFNSFFVQQPALCFLCGAVVASCLICITFYLNPATTGACTTVAFQNTNALETFMLNQQNLNQQHIDALQAFILNQQNTNDQVLTLLSDTIEKSINLLHMDNARVLKEISNMHFNALDASLSSGASIEAATAGLARFTGIT